MATFTATFTAPSSNYTWKAVLTYSVTSTSTATAISVSNVKITKGYPVGTVFAGSASDSSNMVCSIGGTTKSVAEKAVDFSTDSATITVSHSKSVTRTTSDQSVNVNMPIYAWVSGGVFGVFGLSFNVAVPALAKHTVTYAPNGGSSTPAKQTQYYGKAVTLAKAISHANATTATYTVTYNYNGSGASATTAKASTVRKYTFYRWKNTAGTNYEAGKSYTVTGNTTMTAQWTASDTQGKVTLPTPTRTGYSFSGWYTAASGGTKVGAGGASYTPSASITLYAHWTANTYAVKYDANGGTSTPSQQTKTYGVALTLAAAISHANTTPTSYKVTFNYNGSGQAATSATANVTRTWAFSKWKASDGAPYNAKGSYTANAATTMTAQWTTTDTTAQLTLPTPTARTGYAFAGWYTAASGGTPKGGAGAKFTPTAATTLYAHWTANTYTVSFNANGGTGAPASQTKTYDQALTLSSTKPTRIGHTFLGWSTSSTATVATWGAGGTFSTNITANTTLYAVWKSNYAAPKITSLTAVRCNSAGTPDDEGGYAKVTAAWSTMQSIDQGKTANYGTVTGKTRASGTATDVSFTFSSGAGGSGIYSGTAVAIVPNMSTEKSYSVAVSVTDAQGGKTTVRGAVLTSSKFILDFRNGGDGIGIGAAAPSSGLVIGKYTTHTATVSQEGGNINIKAATLDRDGPAPSGENVWEDMRCINLFDRDGETIGRVRMGELTNGSTCIQLLAFNEKGDGGQAYNTLGVFVGKDGSQTYGMSSPANFRDAIGLKDTAYINTTNADTASNYIALNSGFAVGTLHYAAWGKVAVLRFSVKGFAATTGSQTVGTVSSGRRPPALMYGSPGTKNATFCSLESNGEMKVYWNTAPSPSTSYTFSFTYLLA